jgi:hypothetical protein
LTVHLIQYFLAGVSLDLQRVGSAARMIFLLELPFI